jgi:hypothetical protein
MLYLKEMCSLQVLQKRKEKDVAVGIASQQYAVKINTRNWNLAYMEAFHVRPYFIVCWQYCMYVCSFEESK